MIQRKMLLPLHFDFSNSGYNLLRTFPLFVKQVLGMSRGENRDSSRWLFFMDSTIVGEKT